MSPQCVASLGPLLTYLRKMPSLIYWGILLPHCHHPNAKVFFDGSNVARRPTECKGMGAMAPRMDWDLVTFFDSRVTSWLLFHQVHVKCQNWVWLSNCSALGSPILFFSLCSSPGILRLPKCSTMSALVPCPLQLPQLWLGPQLSMPSSWPHTVLQRLAWPRRVVKPRPRQRWALSEVWSMIELGDLGFLRRQIMEYIIYANHLSL